jgi:hypothetical protein
VANKKERKPQLKGKKKTWEKPRLKSGQLFEHNSLACGKADSHNPQCQESGGGPS